jgi:hypothetical protein
MSGPNAIDVVARLRAHLEGRPIPVGRSLPFGRVPDGDRLIVAFVRMGGESLPWGVAFGCPGEAPTLITVPEPRNRDLVAALCARFGAALDRHLPHPSVAGALEREALPVDRQLWLPGASHLEMLHLLALRYTHARRGDADRVAALRRLGRTAGFLQREAARPGQMRVLDATAVLRALWAVPAEDARQAHLGFSLAWHEPGDGAERRAAARRAEARSVGVTMDPHVENQKLAPLLDEWNAAEDFARRERLASAIGEILAPELRRRFLLTERAIRLVDADPRPENPELEPLRELARDELWWGYWRAELKHERGESAFVVHPETDHSSAAAASRFFAQERAAEVRQGALVHGDRDLFERLRETGDAIEGRLCEVVDDNPGRGTTPVWTVVTPAARPVRLRVGARVCPVGQRKRVGRVRALALVGDERHLEIEIVGGKTRRALPHAPAADDAAALEGTTVRLVPATGGQMAFQKSRGAWSDDGPGAWLTHRQPPPSRAPDPAGSDDLLALVEALRGRNR